MGKITKFLKKSKEIVDRAKVKKKTKKHGKVSQEQKDLATTTGFVAAGTLGGAKIQSDRNKDDQSGVGQKTSAVKKTPATISPKGVGAAKRGFGRALK